MTQPATTQAHPTALPSFPAGFVWGAATASYQVEGAVAEDGRGPSVWDTFSHTEGRVADGGTGDVACDHYHRWPQDVDLLADLGLTGYRFSVAWPRVVPDGRGAVNVAGPAFYDRLVDGLLEKGIEPLPTLYHWDLPQPLEDDGGWLSRDTAYCFAEYAAAVAGRLGDRVSRWITLNEPFVHLAEGYAIGTGAPGRELGFDALPAAHHLLLGHGLAAQALRAHGSASGRAPQVLLTNNLTPVDAASDDPADVGAAQLYDTLHNRLFTDPVLLGRYPELLDLSAMPFVHDGDLATIAGTAPLDGLGVNYYNPSRVAAAADGPLPFDLVEVDAPTRTAFGWPVVPSGLHRLLVELRDRYGAALPPVWITENGCSCHDVVAADGAVHDPERIAYLDGHLRALHAAMADGVDVRGYFVWSILDNFEWAAGYAQRFGLVHVDYDTQVRTPKDSYAWLRAELAAQRRTS